MQDTGYRVGSNFIAPQYTEAFAYYPDWNVDGVAVNNAHDADTFRKLDKAIIPYVSMNGVCGEKGVSVLPDEVMGMNLIFGHLRSLGHTCIGYVMHEKLKTVPIQSLHPSVELSRKSYLKAVTHLDQEPILRVTEDDPREMYVKYAIEEKGASKEIGSSLEALINIQLNNSYKKIVGNIDLSELCITSKAEIIYNNNEDIVVNTKKALGEKCPVCWKISPEPCIRHSKNV